MKISTAASPRLQNDEPPVCLHVSFLLRVAVNILRLKLPDSIDFRTGFIANRGFILGGLVRVGAFLSAGAAAGSAEGSAAGIATGTAARTAAGTATGATAGSAAGTAAGPAMGTVAASAARTAAGSAAMCWQKQPLFKKLGPINRALYPLFGSFLS